MTIRTPLARADIPGLARRVCALLEESQAEGICCDVRGLPADLVAVEALARLKLIALRCGAAFDLIGPSAPLRELMALAGLDRDWTLGDDQP